MPAFTLDGPIVGVCVLALAEVIRHGQLLREELDEVIKVPPPEKHNVVVTLDRRLEARAMTLTELAAGRRQTVTNLTVPKNGRATAIRFSTRSAIRQPFARPPGAGGR